MSNVATIDNDTTAVANVATNAHPIATTPYDMVTQAVMNGASIEVVGKLLELHERWEAGRARKAFDAAMSDAKAKIPPIFKNREVGYDAKNGGSRTNYRHEDLAQIAKTVDPILAEYGLSYRFQTQQEGNQVRVTCIVSHRDGHSEENTLQAAHDNTGNKNSIQAVGSTITYLQRYTLKAALGLSASNDDDGKAHVQEALTSITPEQHDELRGLAEANGVDVRKFCEYFKVPSLAELPASEFGRAIYAMAKKAAANNSEAAQ